MNFTKMRIAVIALGSRGDIQPYIALAKGLQTAGNMVRLITHENYEHLVKTHGLEFWPVHGNIQEFAESPEMRALLEKGNFIAVMGYAAKSAEKAALNWAREGLHACQGVDLILAGVGALFIGVAIAERLTLPLVQAHYVPMTPTREFPGALFPPPIARLGGWANKLSHHITRQALWQQARKADAAARQKVLDLTTPSFFGPFNAKPLQNTPVLYGFSSSVISKPADWSENTYITGYWFLDMESTWTPPPLLEEFLSRGTPPIYIGFGSMSSRKPEKTAQLILRAVEKTGQRAILFSGWEGLRAETLPESVFVVDSIPHDWLFDRVAAVVHHGGAGTTAAGLRAGVPSIVIPFFADQPFWGARVAALEVGPEPIPRKELTADKLALAIERALSDFEMRDKAAHLGKNIRAEDGVSRAVEIIQQTTI